MYVRFEDPCDREGLFSIASRYQFPRECRRLCTSRAHARELQELVDWLWRETPVPPREVYKDWACRRPRTWFDPAAATHIRAAWRICTILNKYGERVRPRTCKDPGTILFADGIQVVVRPHREHIEPPSWGELQEREGRPSWDGDRTTIRRWSARAQRRAGLWRLRR